MVIQSGHMHNSPTLWNALVKVQFNVLGDPHCVQLKNATTTVCGYIMQDKNIIICICCFIIILSKQHCLHRLLCYITFKTQHHLHLRLCYITFKTQHHLHLRLCYITFKTQHHPHILLCHNAFKTLLNEQVNWQRTAQVFTCWNTCKRQWHRSHRRTPGHSHHTTAGPGCRSCPCTHTHLGTHKFKNCDETKQQLNRNKDKYIFIFHCLTVVLSLEKGAYLRNLHMFCINCHFKVAFLNKIQTS